MPPDRKRPYDPALAAAAVARHAEDFVATVVARLRGLRERHGRPGLVVAAYDTELFGHWWHEGPAWLEAVLRALPAAGVRVTTLRGALEAGHVGAPVELPASSWGSGKDWRVWDGEQVVGPGARWARRCRTSCSRCRRRPPRFRDPARDQLVREALLTLSSDWAFMVTKDSAADYARRRAKVHADRFGELASLVRAGQSARARARADELRGRGRPVRTSGRSGAFVRF